MLTNVNELEEKKSWTIVWLHILCQVTKSFVEKKSNYLDKSFHFTPYTNYF